MVGQVEREGVGPLETIVKVSATVGCSILQVKPAALDLGFVRSLGAVVRGTFSLRNPSTELPLAFEIQVPPDMVCPVSVTGGGLDCEWFRLAPRLLLECAAWASHHPSFLPCSPSLSSLPCPSRR